MASFVDLLALGHELVQAGKHEAAGEAMVLALKSPDAKREIERAQIISRTYKLIEDEQFSKASENLSKILAENEEAVIDELEGTLDDALAADGADIQKDTQMPAEIKASLVMKIVEAIEGTDSYERVKHLRAAADKLLDSEGNNG